MATITVRLDEEMQMKLRQLTKYYSNPVVKSSNSDVIRYALEKMYKEVSQIEDFKEKVSTETEYCPNCKEETLVEWVDYTDGDFYTTFCCLECNEEFDKADEFDEC